MAGARKWKLNLLGRSDLIALSERAAGRLLMRII